MKSISVVSLLILLFIPGCRIDETVRFQVTVPEENRFQFDAELLKRIGLTLSSEIPVVVKGEEVGNLYFRGETDENNFHFGFLVFGDVFLEDSWVGFRQANRLPSGSEFPSMIAPPMVEVEISPISNDALTWNLYVGVNGEFSLGAAALVSAIGENFPEIDLRYTFHDKAGRPVLGIVFFGPRKNSSGGLLVPGGVFVGTNISPLLRDAGSQTPDTGVFIAGDSEFNYLTITGPDRNKYLDKKQVEKLTIQFAEAFDSAVE